MNFPLLPRLPAWLGPTAAVLATLALLALRAPQTFTNPQFWAEDGSEFFVAAKLYGLGSIIRPYAGHLHLVPRLTALLSNLFSAAEAPVFFTVVAVMASLWSAGTIAAVPLPRAWLYGTMLAAVPHTGEVFGTVTNAQWMLAPALALVTTAPSPSTHRAQRNQLALAFAAGLSGPFSILCLPLIALRLWHDPDDRHGRWLGLLVGGSAAIQLAAFLASHVPDPSPVYTVHVARVMLDRWFGQLAHGERTLTASQWAMTLLVGGAAAAALFTHRRLFPPLLVFTGALLSAAVFKCAHERACVDDLIDNDRYFYLPRLFVLWALVTLLTSRHWTALPAVAALGIILVNAPLWWEKSDQPLLPWRSEAWHIDRGDAVRIVINPLADNGTDGWIVTLPARP